MTDPADTETTDTETAHPEPVHPETTDTEPAAGPASPPARRRVPGWLVVLIGVGAGSLIGLGAVLATRDTGSSSTPALSLAPAETGVPADQQANARAFIAAWQRFRLGTFVDQLTFTRSLTDGSTLTATHLIVQQPPRRVVRQSSTVSSLGGNGQVSCDTVQDQTVCTPPATVDYNAQVQQELVAWASAFAGTSPAYLVEPPDGGCYELRLSRPLAAPPYGNDARYCFDPATGALQSLRITRDGSTDIETADRISATVTEADFVAARG